MTKKINNVLGIFVLTALSLGFTASAQGATYHYVNTSGGISSVNASSSQEAIRIATNLAPHSGVILVDGNSTVVNTNNYNVQGDGLYVYEYINTSGQVQSITANSPQEAIRMANNLATHSGVIVR